MNKITIRCAKCGARFFDIMTVQGLEGLKKETPKVLKCYQCNAYNLIRVENGYIRVDVIDE